MTEFIVGMLVAALLVVGAILFFRERRPIWGAVLLFLAVPIGFTAWASAIVVEEGEVQAPTTSIEEVVATPTPADS